MNINVYTSFNGVGLEKDFKLLKSSMEGHVVNGFDYKRKEKGGRCNLTFHLEIPRFDCINGSYGNIMIPNPEWFFNGWNVGLRKFQEVWCKTKNCLEIFRKIHPNCIYSGFKSDDFFLPDVKKEKTIVHLHGKSKTKGTKQIIEAYRNHPELPECLFIGSDVWDVSGCKNIKVLGRISEEELKILMNKSLIHLCPSSYEGWGHYLHEAFSCGISVITTDFPPMNEFLNLDLVKTDNHPLKMNMAMTGTALSESIAEKILLKSSKSEEELKKEGEKNREGFLKRNLAFEDFVRNRFSDIYNKKSIITRPTFPAIRRGICR